MKITTFARGIVQVTRLREQELVTNHYSLGQTEFLSSNLARCSMLLP